MCGIWGYSGKNFNKYKFNILGLYNDTRGGDSCGIVIGNDRGKQVLYGHGPTKLYSKFIESGVKIDFNQTKFALGHCRKASVGGIGEMQAQPVIIYDNEMNLKFAMIHNGTLFNYKALADKYEIKYEHTETDSQIFCRIVYNVGYKVLDEYDGAGAFMFWDSRDGDDTIKVFKGASLYYQNDNLLYVERPLFMLKNKNSMWFSSIEDSLKFINDQEYTIENVQANVLLTIKNGKIIGEDKVDRSKRQQVVALIYNSTYQQQQFPLVSRGSNYYDDWDEYDEATWTTRRDKKFEERSNFRPALISTQKTDKVLLKINFSKNKIYFDVDGLYKLNEELCNGSYECSPAGYIDCGKLFAKKYYFVHGVMMKSFFDYLCAKEYCTIFFKDDDIYPAYLVRYSTTPVPMEWEDAKTGAIDTVFYIEDIRKPGDFIEFSGEFSPYFSFNREIYTVDNGYIEKYTAYADKNEYFQDLLSDKLDKEILDSTISDERLLEMIYENIQVNEI